MQARIRTEHFVPPLLALVAVLITALAPRLPAAGAQALEAVLQVLPPALFLLFFFLALRLNRLEACGAALLFLMSGMLLRAARSSALLGGGLVFYACALSLTIPPGLFLLSCLPEGTLFGPRGVLLIAAPALPFLLVLLLRVNPGWVTGLFNFRLVPLLPGWYLPDGSLVLSAALGVRLLLDRRPIDGPFRYALFWSLFPFLSLLNAALTGPPSSLVSRIPVATAAIFLILLYGLYRLYWQRVYCDELTGIPNRRAFNECLQGLGRRFALAMVDIDHFKAFNDAYGHAEGDNVLRWVAAHVARESGFQAYRYGGEEFALVFRGSRAAGAPGCLEEMRRRLAETDFFIRSPGRRRIPWWRHRGPEDVKVRVRLTISVGLAGPDRQSRRPAEVLRRADEALYQAKKLGRNRVVEAGSEAEVAAGGR